MAVFCKCILDKEDLESGKYYDLKALFRSDPASKEAYDKMDPDGCVLDLEWEMVGGFSDLEVSIEVLRNGEIAEGDGDAVKIQAIKRRHPWRKDGWSRIELLSDLKGGGGARERAAAARRAGRRTVFRVSVVV